MHRNWITNFGWHFVLHAGTVGYAMIVAPGVTVTFTCTGPADQSTVEPTWFVNGEIAETEGDCYRSILRRAEGLIYTATLMINGNRTCDSFIIYCRIYRDSQFLYLHNATLTFQGKWLLYHLVTYSCLRCNNMLQLARPLSLYNVSHRSSSFTWKRSQR